MTFVDLDHFVSRPRRRQNDQSVSAISIATICFAVPQFPITCFASASDCTVRSYSVMENVSGSGALATGIEWPEGGAWLSGDG